MNKRTQTIEILNNILKSNENINVVELVEKANAELPKGFAQLSTDIAVKTTPEKKVAVIKSRVYGNWRFNVVLNSDGVTVSEKEVRDATISRF